MSKSKVTEGAPTKEKKTRKSPAPKIAAVGDTAYFMFDNKVQDALIFKKVEEIIPAAGESPAYLDVTYSLSISGAFHSEVKADAIFTSKEALKKSL